VDNHPNFVIAALQPDGKIIAVDVLSSGQWQLVRYLPNGALDPSFGKGGIDVTGLGRYFLSAVTSQAGGKILVAGDLNMSASVVRFNPNGTLDGTFGKEGIATVTFPSGLRGDATAVVVQSDGRIVMGGDATRPYPSQQPAKTALVRFLPSGRLDSSFGKNGIALINGNPVTALAVARDGTFDTASTDGLDVQTVHFSANGGFIASPPSGNLAVIQSNSSITFQADAKIVIGQSGGYHSSNQNARLTKFNSIDPSFQTPFYRFGSGAVDNLVNAIAVELNGKILTAGQGDEFGLGRFNPNGSLDTGFGSGGLVTTAFFTGPGTGSRILALLLQPDGKIIAIGDTYNNPAGTRGIALARYLGP